AGRAAPLGDLERDQVDPGGDPVDALAVEGGGDASADPAAVAVPVGVGRAAELVGQVLVRDVAAGVLRFEAGEVDHLLDPGAELAVGVVEAGVGHPDGHLGAAGGGPPALGQADAAVVPQQALVVPGRVGVDPGRGGGRRRLGLELGRPAHAGGVEVGRAHLGGELAHLAASDAEGPPV